MNAIQSAFANLHNFLHFIVLPNCTDYFDEQELHPEDSTRRAEHRSLFNVVVALDSAVDHAYWAKPRPVSFEQYREDLIKAQPIVGKVRELANALKHCIIKEKPHKPKPNAADLAKVTVVVDIDDSGALTVDLNTEFLLDAAKTVEDAFAYWLAIAQKLDTEDPP